MNKLGYLGPTGTFTEIAAKKYQQEVREYVPYSDIKSLLEAVLEEDIDQAIVPVENSLEGAVTLTLDLLVELDLKINNEIIIAIEHSLLAKEQVKLEQIKHVISHRQALAQCRKFLEENLVDYQIHIANSTAEAVKKLKNLNGCWAAIGNQQAANYYDLQILANQIQDNQENWTRFIVLDTNGNTKSNQDKTSIVCSPQKKDHPGALYDILHEFAIRGINLTRIESRPARKLLGDYIFFIDFEGHYQEPEIKEALEILAVKTSWCTLLGSYPRSTVIDEYSDQLGVEE
ncbi:prephenate dehydratase [Natroniella acetigena]|uniref:prephenate dehydratase n=1 Tax=Natroniella acetigena TaxID=52004 RepID=UPI00200B777F|nr:prephenate dehydratase [Natroniella acetigena]